MPTVLVVNDEPAQLAMLAGLLRRDGLTVRTAANGAEGLEGAQGCDLIVLDLNLPDLPGIEVLEQLRARGMSATVVAISASPPSRAEEARLQAAGSQVLAPYRPADVRQAVRAVFAGEAPASPPAPEERTVDGALARLKAAGGQALVSKVVTIFLDKLPSSLQTLTRALEAGDFELAERTAHSLKGSAGMLGAARVQELCQQVEEAAASQTAARGALEALRGELRSLRERLQSER